LAQGRSRKADNTPLSVLLVEGETEKIFYERVKDLRLKNVRLTISHIGGLYNVHKKLLNRIVTKYNDEPVRIYCCLDRENRYAQTPEFDLEFIKAL